MLFRSGTSFSTSWSNPAYINSNYWYSGNQWGPFEYIIPNYTNSGTNTGKSLMIRAGSMTTTGSGRVMVGQGTYNTNNALSSITISAGGTAMYDVRVSLYGWK